MTVMDPSNMVNAAMIELAFTIAESSILDLIKVQKPRIVWGPRSAIAVVVHPILIVPMAHIFGPDEPWDPKWGEPNSSERIAKWKAETAQREGKPTSELTLVCPWDHEPGDYLYPGGVVAGKLGVGVSGYEGFADEIVANIVLDLIKGFCKLKREQLRENHARRLE